MDKVTFKSWMREDRLEKKRKIHAFIIALGDLMEEIREEEKDILTKSEDSI